MASIQRIKSEVRVKGHAAQSQTFPNKREAQAWASSVESAIRENRYFPHAKAGRTLFVELIERYRREVLPQFKVSGRGTREQHLDYWRERLVGKVLGEVTPDVVAKARDEHKRNGEPLIAILYVASARRRKPVAE